MSTVLVVDDDVLVCTTISKMIESSKKHKAISTNDPTKALELAVKRKPDLIVLDIVMPEMSGLEVLRQIKGDARTATTPVIMLTAIDNPEWIAEAMQGYAEQYLLKPVERHLLLQRIDEILFWHGMRRA